VAWTETASLSFVARHEADDADAVATLLDDLESLRATLEGSFERIPGEIAVVVHPRPLMLSLAAPWLPLARLFSAPAGRRYFAGWFASGEIHVLAPAALERRASAVPGSREALLRSPRHEYAHLVLGANNPALPPPFSPASFRRYLEMAWLCEGGATHLAGQVGHMRPAILRRLREGGVPSFPPPARDAWVLGGTVFDLLERERGRSACLDLLECDSPEAARQAIADAFGRPTAAVERSWRDYLAEATAA
jgi:hypothetical protein